MKSLVVYYSRTGNAKFVAETVAAELGSDIEEVVDLKKRDGKLGWISASRDASGGKQTEIAPTTKNPKDYELSRYWNSCLGLESIRRNQNLPIQE